MTQEELEQLAAETRRAYNRAYYHANKAQVLKKRKERRDAKHEEMLEKERAYRMANPDKVRKWQATHWAKKAMQQTAKKKK